MARYFCNHCDNYIVDDWKYCEPDPDDESCYICKRCADNIRCDECEALTVQIDIDCVNGSWRGIRECPKCETNDITNNANNT